MNKLLLVPFLLGFVSPGDGDIIKPDLPVINEDYYVNIQSDVYGPYLDHESGEHSVTIAFKKNNIGKTVDTINVHLRVYNERNGNIILSRYFNNLTLSKFVPKTITFNLPIESYLNEFGMKIILDVNSNDGHYSE